MVDDLVVDGHHEQWRGQGQQVDHHRREADLPQHGAHIAHRRRAPEAAAGGEPPPSDARAVAEAGGHLDREGRGAARPDRPGQPGRAVRARTSQAWPGSRPRIRNGGGRRSEVARAHARGCEAEAQRRRPSPRQARSTPVIGQGDRGAQLRLGDRPLELAAQAHEGQQHAVRCRGVRPRGVGRTIVAAAIRHSGHEDRPPTSRTTAV